MDLEGAAHLVLAQDVRYLDEASSVVEAMLANLERQHLVSATIGPRRAAAAAGYGFAGPSHSRSW